MSFETPEHIDLSQQEDIAKLKSHLTPEENQRLDEYFDTQKEGIILLTQSELEELKFILGEDASASHEADYDEFIEAQITEGISLAEIIGEDSAFSEDIEVLQGGAQEILFGNEGILSGLDISDAAQNSFSAAFAMSIVEKLSNGDISLEDIVSLQGENQAHITPENILLFFGGITPVLAGFKELANATEQVPGSVATMSQLYISDNGDTNSIFMNPEEGKDFFLTLLEGNMTQDEIKALLESKNNITDIPHIDVAAISESLGGSIGNLQERLETILVLAPEDTGSPVVTDIIGDIAYEGANASPEEKNIFEKLMDLLKAFFSGLVNISDDVFSNNTQTDRGDEMVPEAEEIAPTQVESTRQLLLARKSEGALRGISEDSIQDYFESAGSIERLIVIMREIPDSGNQDTPEEKLENVLFTNISSSETPKLLAFIDAGNLEEVSNNDGTLNVENFESALQKYKDYRIAREEDSSLLYSEFFEAESGE